MIRAACLILPALALCACGGTEFVCDEGERLEGDDRCVPVDAGGADSSSGDGGERDGGEPDADAGEPDAGPCGGACEGATPVCDGARGECVECTGDEHCTDERCDTDAGECVACVEDADCTDPTAAKCDTTAHACVACDDSSQCAGVGDTNVCATEGSRAGECVECTADDRASCASGVCLLTDNACAPEGGSADACTACVADAECMAGMLCVPWTYDDPRTAEADPVAAGTQCAWRQDASGAGAPGGACSTIRPYVRSGEATSVDGVTATVCTLALSTCEAQADFRSVDCMTLDAAGDARCGMEGVGDGVCRMFDSAANRCTVFCGSHDDCPVGFNCNTSGSPRVCQFM